MPIEVGIWRLVDKAEPVVFEPMPSEQHLEDMIAGDISILVRDLLLIGRQVQTAFDKYIDLLAMDTLYGSGTYETTSTPPNSPPPPQP